ncbi:MAG: hypothetical protein ABW170_24120 [Candidatus Thiodiazotropha sp. L084R]
MQPSCLNDINGSVKHQNQKERPFSLREKESKRVFDLVMLFGTSESPKSTRPLTAYCAPTVLRTSRFRIAQTQQAAGALLHHDSRK